MTIYGPLGEEGSEAADLYGVYACFCEVDHDLAPVSDWCENCQERAVQS